MCALRGPHVAPGGVEQDWGKGKKGKCSRLGVSSSCSTVPAWNLIKVTNPKFEPNISSHWEGILVKVSGHSLFYLCLTFTLMACGPKYATFSHAKREALYPRTWLLFTGLSKGVTRGWQLASVLLPPAIKVRHPQSTVLSKLKSSVLSL